MEGWGHWLCHQGWTRCGRSSAEQCWAGTVSPGTTHIRLVRACPIQHMALEQEVEDTGEWYMAVSDSCLQGGARAPGRRFWEEEPGRQDTGAQGGYCGTLGKAKMCSQTW